MLVALLAVVVTFAVRSGADPWLQDRAPYLLFTLAVVVSAVAGGVSMGLFATVVSALLATWSFLPPRGSLAITSLEYGLEAGVFLTVAVAVSLLAGRMRDARDRAEAARHRVAASEADLRNLHRDLEGLVIKRTADLEAANNQLEAFAYTVSHDLRAPLRSMEGFARILLDDFGQSLGPRGQRHAERIVAAAQRMEGLIADLLAFSRLQRVEVKLRALDPTPIICAAAEQARAVDATDQSTVEVEEPLPSVVAEPVILEQVMVNLLQNAIKFRKTGEPARVRIYGECHGMRVRLWVEDQGIGIAPEHQQKIFSVFERLHGQETFPGTGIGLAIVRTGAVRMGGSVGVESELKAGARFWVELAAPSVAA